MDFAKFKLLTRSKFISSSLGHALLVLNPRLAYSAICSSVPWMSVTETGYMLSKPVSLPGHTGGLYLLASPALESIEWAWGWCEWKWYAPLSLVLLAESKILQDDKVPVWEEPGFLSHSFKDSYSVEFRLHSVVIWTRNKRLRCGSYLLPQ